MSRNRGPVDNDDGDSVGTADERTILLPAKEVSKEGEEKDKVRDREKEDGTAWRQEAGEDVESRRDDSAEQQQQQQPPLAPPPSTLPSVQRCNASTTRQGLRAELLGETTTASGHRRHHSADMRTMQSEPAIERENSLAVVSEWAPRKLSEGNITDTVKTGHTRIRSPTKRKLSESRGVNLPDIRILVETPKSPIKSKDERMNGRQVVGPSGSLPPMQSPPLTSSPLGHTLRRILTIDTSAPPRSTSPGSTKSNINAVISICVFLPDNRGIQFAVEGGRLATAQCLMELVCEHLQIPNALAQNAFAIWMISPLLEVQLKPHHIALDVRRNWAGLLKKFTNASVEAIEVDEPLLMFRRNVLLSLENERNIYYHEKATEVLFLDARDQVLNGRYPCDIQDALHLAVIDMALTLGPYKESHHTLSYIKEALEEFLPEQHVNAVKSFSLFGYHIAGCKGFEQEVLDEYRAMPKPHNPLTLRIAYLNAVSHLPFYGAAFFHGQIERPPSRDILRVFKPAQSDLHILVGINREYITVMDPHKHTVLLSEPITDCSWRRVDSADPSNVDSLPSFFLHFPDDSASGADDEFGFKPSKSKLLQVFSRQAVMMDALLNAVYSCFVAECEDEDEDEEEECESGEDEVDGVHRNGTVGRRLDDDEEEDEDEADRSSPNSVRLDYSTSSTLSNKLNRLCLATFDSGGRCVEAQGSLRRVLKEDS